MKFRYNLFTLSIESSSWFGHILSTLTVYKMENETSFEIRAYIKRCSGLNISVSEISSDFLKEEKVIQLSCPPYSPDLRFCEFFLYPLLKKNLSYCCNESQRALGSAIYPFLQGIPKKGLFLCVYRMNFET